jgi:ribosomal protein S18 acetylase RimI-like enzyme
MVAPNVRSASRDDENAVVDVVTLAFAADPMARWSLPDPTRYLAVMPSVVRAFGGRAFEMESADCVEDCSGAALWLAPGVEPDGEALMALIQQNAPHHVLPDLLAVFEQMAGYHPEGPHWYLPLIGVDPAAQGRGIGSGLMRHALARCDRDGLPAYLESSNSRNIPLYLRHGFEILGTIQVGGSPPVVPMLRQPRAGS